MAMMTGLCCLATIPGMKSAFLAAVYPALDKASAIQGNA